MSAILLAFACLVRWGPFDAPETRAVSPGTTVLDASGILLGQDARAGLRVPVGLTEVAPVMLQATISAEDRRFRQHPGVDPIAIARAALTSAATGRSGASTITQQVARRLYLGGDTSPAIVRKLREAVLALQLEQHRSKSEILGLYLNDVYYGRGAYGVEAAARVYFGTSAGNLDLAHAAYLAGLPQRPSLYESPSGEAAAKARQQYVLGRMVEDSAIARADADAAARQAIAVVPAAPSANSPHFVAFALDELARIRPDLAERDGLVVETTLDAGLQRETERLTRLRLAALGDRHVTNAAVVAIEPGTGRLLAMVGGATDGDPSHGGAINMAITPRQPGSALKPLVYAAAFERGFAPATALLDVPTTFPTAEGPYAPLNFDRSFHGVVPLRVALASSLNVPAVRTLDAIGLDAMLEMTRRFGLGTLSSAESYGLSLALGGGDVRLLDLTSAYAALAAQGRWVEPFSVARVRDAAGHVLYERAAPAPRRVLSPQHAYLLTDILSDADARITGFGLVTPFDLPFPAAVKSGTSTGFRDNWTLGYTPDIAIGVWVGNADGSAMVDVSGIDGAGPIWHDAMMAAAIGRRMSWYARPTGIVEVTVCAPTGLLPGTDCPAPTRELFVAGTEPQAREHYYSRDEQGRVAIDPPTEARAWARDAGLALAVRGTPAAGDLLRIVAPAGGSVFWLAPELSAQQLVLRAAAAPGLGRVAFEVDGRIIGDAPGADPWLVWTLAPGRHTLRVSAQLADGNAAAAVSSFEVRR